MSSYMWDDSSASDTSREPSIEPPDTLLVPSSDSARTNLLSLPNETLALILLHLSKLAPACPSPSRLVVLRDLKCRIEQPFPKGSVGRIGWIVATHVCSRLRSIALGLPRLWASIIVAGYPMRWLSDILQRSGSQGLSLYLPSAYSDWTLKTTIQKDDTAYMAVLSQPCHLWRVKHVTCTGLRHWLPFVSHFLSNPAPQLESLRLGPHGPPDVREITTVLPKKLFGPAITAPRLRSLTLVQCDFSWTCLKHFSTLTVLYIARPYHALEEYKVQYALPSGNSKTAASPKRRRPAGVIGKSMDEVVACLHALPSLQELTLQNALPNWTRPRSDPPEYSPIFLPELRRIHIDQWSLQPLSCILDLLHAPQLCFCELKYSTVARPMGADLQARYAPLMRSLTRFASNLPTIISRVSMEFGNPNITLCAHHTCTEGHKSQHRLCLKITIGMAIIPDSEENWPIRHTCIEPILSALPLSHLEELDISDWFMPIYEESYLTVDFSFWSRIYSLCASTRKLKASAHALLPLLPLLTHRNLPSWYFDSDSVLPPVPRTPAFPDLQTLELVVNKLGDFKFDRGVALCFAGAIIDVDRDNDGVETTVRFIHGVRDCLQSRSERLSKLQHLSMLITTWDKDENTEILDMFKYVFREAFVGLVANVDPLNIRVDRYSHLRARTMADRYCL